MSDAMAVLPLALSLSAIVGVAVYIILGRLKEVKMPKLSLPENMNIAERIESAGSRLNRPAGLSGRDLLTYAAGFAGAVTGLGLTWGSGMAVKGAAIGMCAGAACVFGAYKVGDRMNADMRRREVIDLFNAVQLYVRTGMSVKYALDTAKALAPKLRSAVNKAIVYWRDPSEALEILREGIDLPEGDVFVSLLAQIDQAGIVNLVDIIGRESRRLEQLHEANERARITMKPLYLVLYQSLPLLASLGLFVGAYFMRAWMGLQNIGLMK